MFMSKNRKDTMDYTMTFGQDKLYRFLCCLWLVSNWFFWLWWIQPKHIVGIELFITLTACLFYEFTILPSFYLFFLSKMSRPKPIQAPTCLKVAIITLCVPSKESLKVIENQIVAMKKVSYLHDSWLLDEENNPEVKKLCYEYGVEHFTRKGIEKWNQPKPPFQKKTKAGNVNAWLDTYGHQYEFFVQLDIDHNPESDYLDKVLGYFNDKKVGWVQAPSVYKNLEYWTARGAAEQEFVLQGPLQMGFYGFSQTPFIIGSHTTYRTRAIIEIGGFQPTRAEDHLDTIVLASRGYRGVFLPEIIAKGDGPESFETYLNQQFAWAYSMIHVLLRHTPKYLFKFSFRQAIQFLFAETWYPVWSLNSTILFLLPIVSLIINQPLANISFLSFLGFFLPLQALAFIVWFWSRKWFQPKGLRLSWRGILLQIARWPIVLWALINVLLGIKKPYMITPKGTMVGKKRAFKIATQIPYLALIFLSLVVICTYLVRFRHGPAQGYILFALWGIGMMLAVFIVALSLDIKEMIREGVSKIKALGYRGWWISISVLLVVLFFVITNNAFPLIAEATAWRPRSIIQPPIILASSLDEETKEKQIDMVKEIDFKKEIMVTPETLILQNQDQTDIEAKTKMPETEASINLSEGFTFGAYDPNDTLKDLKFEIGHEFVAWQKDNGFSFSYAVDRIRGQKRFPMISWEPWVGDDFSILDEITNGNYDNTIIRPVAQQVKNFSPQIVIIRLAHEMDLPDLYPWSTPWEKPEKYIHFWQHVVKVFREEGVENVWWLWSPSGNLGVEIYYPGDDYVDFVGLTVFSYAKWDEKRSFTQLMDKKWPSVDQFGKPVIIAELGISGNEEAKRDWLIQAHNNLQKYTPQLKGIVYFNDINVPNLLSGRTPPDWRINEELFQIILEEQKAKTE